MAAIRLLASVLFAVAALAPATLAPRADHRHLYSPVAEPFAVAGWKGVTAANSSS